MIHYYKNEFGTLPVTRGIGDLQRKLSSQVIIERKIMSAFLLTVWKH